jgi:hypothetical protein
MAIDKTKKFADLAYEYIRKLLIKPSKGGITSLPTDKEITNEMLQMFEKLRGAGYNVTNIGKEVKNADDLGFLLNRIDQAQLDQSKQFLDSAEALETIQYKLNNNIPLNPDDQKKLLGKGFKTASEAFQGFTPKVIQGGKKEGIEQLLKSGDVKKGVAPKTKPKDFNQEIRDLVAADEAAMGRAEDFKSFESRIKGMSSKDRVAERLKDLKGVDLFDLSGIEAQKIASEVIGRKGPFKTISNKGAKEVLGELDPIIKRADAEVDLGKNKMIKDFEERNERALEDLVDDAGGTKEGVEFDDEPFDAAKGGIARIGFEKGGMSRRTFLKLMGGLASIPLVGKFLKPAAKVAKTAEIAKQSGVPAYFPKLVEKIKLLGDDVTRTTATQERQVVTKYKDYEMTENLSTGNIEIEKTNEGMGTFVDMSGEVQTYDGIASKELIEYTPPETIIGKDGKPVKVPAQYDETTARSTGFDGKLEDFSDGLDSYDEILEEVGESKIKKSGGGLAYMMGE